MKKSPPLFLALFRSIDIADLLILAGLAAVLVGLYLVDLRLALVVGGLVLIGVGLARLRLVQRGARQR